MWDGMGPPKLLWPPSSMIFCSCLRRSSLSGQFRYCSPVNAWLLLLPRRLLRRASAAWSRLRAPRAERSSPPQLSRIASSSSMKSSPGLASVAVISFLRGSTQSKRSYNERLSFHLIAVPASDTLAVAHSPRCAFGSLLPLSVADDG